MSDKSKGTSKSKTERIGETNISKYGELMTIISYIRANDIEVQFEDGNIIKTSYRRFKDGTAKNPSIPYTKVYEKQKKTERIGETNISKYGELMTIISYIRAKDIEVQFENGNIIKTSYGRFKDGTARNPSIPYTKVYEKQKKTERIGETNISKYGELMEIISYTRTDNIEVRFEDGNIIKTSYTNFKYGTLITPYTPTIEGRGYMGMGNYNSVEHSVLYDVWSKMLKRCYNEKTLQRQPAYKGCEVASIWYNFQNFAKWYEDNYYKLKNERVDLDKDILKKGNRLYGPETCIFVPQVINTLFTKSTKTRGLYPIGVSKKKGRTNKPYSATLSTQRYDETVAKKNGFLGYYKTPEEAFQAYKEAKEAWIKEVAEYYKAKIPEKLYNALLAYEVEITD